jgi:hypothetical protein
MVRVPTPFDMTILQWMPRRSRQHDGICEYNKQPKDLVAFKIRGLLNKSADTGSSNPTKGWPLDLQVSKQDWASRYRVLEYG